jgi:putative membrane protein
MHWGDMGTWGWGGWIAGAVMMLIFWAGLAAVILLALRRPGGGSTPHDPERILAERFARGEIDEEEYQHRLRVLR